MSDVAHHRALAHQFDDLEQQVDCCRIGMWTFLITEVLMFGGLFLGYAYYRLRNPAAYAAASHQIDLWLGLFNTVVLILSSLTMALAVHASQERKKGELVRFLVATIFLGLVFLGVKVVEYSGKFAHHLVPGRNFDFHNHPELAGGAEIFFSFYFAMTGLHASHMIIGIGVLIAWVILGAKGRFTDGYYAPIELTGLYWHFVDIVWIFLFPLLYLIGRHV